MRFARVRNYDRYQVHTERSDMVCLSLDTFHDAKLTQLDSDERLGWIAVLIAAKRHKNAIPLPPGDPIRAFVATGATAPTFKLNRYVQLRMVDVLNDAPAESEPARLAKKRSAMIKLDCPENRAVIDDLNMILGRKMGYTVTLLQAAQRLRDLGYKVMDWRLVFERVASATIGGKGIASWCKEKFNADYLLRPGEMGAFDKILNLEEPKIQTQNVAGPRSAADILSELQGN